MTHLRSNQIPMAGAGEGTGGGGSAGGAAAPDFGTAGKLTIRHDIGAVALHLSDGQYLSYTLTVKGGVSPVFTFTCIHRQILSDKTLGGPKKSYAWDYFKSAGDEDSHDDTYTVTMSFLGAPLTYTLVVKQCDKTGKVLQTLVDLDCFSTDPTDFYMDGLRVFTL